MANPALEESGARPPSITELARPTLPELAWGDVKRIAAALVFGCGAAALVELVVTPVVARDFPAVGTLFRFLLLDLTLFAIVYLGLASLLGLAAVVTRVALLAEGRDRARGFRGLFAPRSVDRPSPSASRLWAGAIAVLCYLGASARLTARLSTTFKEPQLVAALAAVLQLVLILGCAALAWVVAALLYRAGRRLHDRLGSRAWLNPLGDPTAAAVGLLVVGLPVVAGVLLFLPQLRPLVPWRHLVAVGVIALGTRLGLHLLARRGRLLPAAPRWRLAVLGGILFAGALVLPVTLIAIGADAATKSLAISASPPLRTMVDGLRRATDFDGDGFGTLLGENDCAPFDAKIRPLARDLPDNGIDENCDGRDFELGRVPSYRKGKRMPVPPAFRQKWNVLLVTVDTVRYDHTTMGGYTERTGRETTPELAKLAARSTSFSFASAPSAGTMASVPAILTSKFFHSGIALDETVKRGLPPRLKPENLLVAEMFKAAGFTTGAILSHEWFNDWGMKQGFDTYDNLVSKSDPYGSSADRVTDAALSWIGQRGEDEWFLWLHYIDPHGRYVAHPGERSFGATEEDLYDGELAWTDKNLGRLFDELGRLPGAERTVIVLTSDHGDGFNDHGFINHGVALYRELLHVPLIVFVPNLPARAVGGAVSPLDIVPTLIDLCGLDARGAELEGESLVPQLFYDQDAGERVVFAETNASHILRAAITSRHKLIYDIKANVYELYDLRADPWEKKNLWPRGDQAGFDEMKRYLDDWLERVYYARDPAKNQAMSKMADVLLTAPPEPRTRLDGATLDGGAIQVLGFESDKDRPRPGDKIELSIYFHAVRRPSADLQFQVEAWRDGGDGKQGAARSSMKATAGGLLPSSRWRDGEFVRDRIKVRLPENWATPPGGKVVIGLRAQTAAGKKPVRFEGPTRDGDDAMLILGELELDASAAPAPPPGKAAPKPGKK